MAIPPSGKAYAAALENMRQEIVVYIIMRRDSADRFSRGEAVSERGTSR
jgi:hypothetical protein